MTRSVAAVLLAVFVLVSMPPAALAQGAAIKIGSLAPLTGPFAQIGKDMVNVGYALQPFIDGARVPATYPVIAADDITQRKPAKWIVRTGWSTPQNPKFARAFEAKAGKIASYYSEAAYTNMRWISEAVTAVNGKVEDRPALLAALRKVDIKDYLKQPLYSRDYPPCKACQ